MQEATAALELSGLTKRYDDTQTGWRRSGTRGLRALDAVDLSVRDGEFFGLLGADGAGKSTLISADGLCASYDADSLADVSVKATAG